MKIRQSVKVKDNKVSNWVRLDLFQRSNAEQLLLLQLLMFLCLDIFKWFTIYSVYDADQGKLFDRGL